MCVFKKKHFLSLALSVIIMQTVLAGNFSNICKRVSFALLTDTNQILGRNINHIIIEHEVVITNAGFRP